ncbi:hypothetical protein [Saccharothrix syringae]|uniref:hypothetical protein n=1 Tax=Saccharothrix syringae TaxID=103733 RepID=UPI00068B1384|nr:hypothetical protein [Saccharothrix syringae]
MTRTRAVALATTALLGALLGACGQPGRPGAAVPAGPDRVDAAAGGEIVPGAPELTTAVVPDLGTVLADGDGLTLYRSDRDTNDPPTSTCDGDCARRWPPALADSVDVRSQGVDQALLGTLDRPDGTRQVTVAGWPVYHFAADTAPGRAGGQGADGTWFAAAPNGRKALPPTADLALATASVGALGTVLTDRTGMTLYRSERDTTDPPTSTCEDACALRWPPLLVGSPDFGVQGVDRSLVGTTTRADGRLQVTVAGRPLYLFAGDRLCGDAGGQGLDGVWFAARTDGSRA